MSILLVSELEVATIRVSSFMFSQKDNQILFNRFYMKMMMKYC